MKKIEIFDSTLRDGAQSEGINFSIEDKLAIVRLLDRFGVSYIEAGNPGSNPKDMEFFERLKHERFKQAKLTAFGSTRRKNIACSEDKNLLSLLSANTETVAVFGKCWDLHVTEILGTTLAENLKMIEETVAFLAGARKEVVFDAEHFFDGFKANPKFAMDALKAAVLGGASVLALCDTNGGMFPSEIFKAVSAVRAEIKNVQIGIHCHNDGGMAVANSIAAVEAGANHIQGTFIGYGERSGNANLSTIIANLQIKSGLRLVPENSIAELTSTARKLAELSNIRLDRYMPYVGESVFTHKAGMHADGVLKLSASFEHIDPSVVGNSRKFVMSEIAGRTAIALKIGKYFPNITKNSPEIAVIADRIKKLEHEGYQFETAEPSLILEVCKILGLYKPYFELISYDTSTYQPCHDDTPAKAIVKIRVSDKTQLTCAEGDGPVNALDIAIRQCLEVFYPKLGSVMLIDFKVRVLESQDATASKVRVLLTSTDGKDVWTTVGVSTDIIQASFKALTDSIEYKLMSDDGIISKSE